ncbi:MFS general substrate transporter [Auriscalpium vulgare]|uniref:MFS general substrate transporter n=1 Tax=Auriscalpium vulgare TaxID=40419 RepID=A0ACB8S154_9AGAM|nr:MFS general substrate transporter [Auriscalpium vulgare]
MSETARPVSGGAPTDEAHTGAGSDLKNSADFGARTSSDEPEKTALDGDLKEIVQIVDWEGPDDPENPKNWTFRKKWSAMLIVSAFTFISPVSSSMVAPAAQQISDQFGITSSAIAAMTISVFVLAYAVGPLFLGPLSEMYGRAPVLQISNMWYFAWNLGCGFAQNTGQLIAFRFLAGLGGSAPLAVGGGTVGDLFSPDQRGKAMALYSMAPLLGPIIGPIAGAWIAERSTWRWVFYSTTIADAVVQAMGLLFLRETYAPRLLQYKAQRIRLGMDEEKANRVKVRTVFETADRTPRALFRKAIVRAFVLFGTEPIVQLFGIYMAFVYGILYLFLTTIPSIFRDNYHESTGILGLHYIPLGLGLFTASQVNSRLLDKTYAHFKAKNGGVGKPEFRLPSAMPGTCVLPIGILMAGWAAQKHVHWIVVDIGIFLVGASVIVIFQGFQTYVVDAFTLHAASALAAVSFLRSLAGFGFPLFGPAMYNALGFGKGDTILAVVAIVLGIPAPWVFWLYGERIRNASRNARHDLPRAS